MAFLPGGEIQWKRSEVGERRNILPFNSFSGLEAVAISSDLCNASHRTHPVTTLTKTVLWATACFRKGGGQAPPAAPGAAPLLFQPQPCGGGGIRVVFSLAYICSCPEPGATAAATASKVVCHAGGGCLAKASS